MTPKPGHQDGGRCFTPPAHTPRLRLKSKSSQRGCVDGAWWPRSADLTTELPDLLAVLSVRLGRIDRVLYNLNEWDKASRRLVTDTTTVRLDGYRLQPANTIEVLGLNQGRIVLLVVPPLSDPGDAHTALMSAVVPNDTSTVDSLLVISARDRDARTETEAARERWDSDGGHLVSSASTSAVAS